MICNQVEVRWFRGDKPARTYLLALMPLQPHAAGLILENWRCKRKKHLWLSIGSDLRFDSRRCALQCMVFSGITRGLANFHQRLSLAACSSQVGMCPVVSCCAVHVQGFG